ncbi:MAG: M23 family metallopeptidase [Rhodococcus sp.]|nr:M23 family metallopeptidase [Rhodococcus sp. (in: high G+C Gram-positive bacteria)]
MMMRTSIPAIVLALLVTITWPSSVDAAESEFDWPLQPRPRVERAFDKPEHNWLPGHRGVDLAGQPDEAVLSAGAGVVVFAGTVADKPVVSVDHDGGLRTTYEPVVARVRAGQRVGVGTVLGVLEPDHPGCTAAACLHWGLRRSREYLNPLRLVDATPLRLKPLQPDHARG